MADFTYTPLPPINEIGRTPPFTRALTLYPGNNQEPLICTLDIIDVENPPWPFEALSYVWGRDRAMEPLICARFQLSITLNLDQALRHLRLPNLKRRLWIDAICINQQDFSERARQVQYMRLIYIHAHRTIVWLGLSTTGMERAFDLAKTLSELQNEMMHSTAGASDPVQATGAAKSIMMQVLAEHVAADDLSRLFAIDYFERVWCIQEVVASNMCTAKCGRTEMDFFELLSLVSYVDARQGFAPASSLQFWGHILNTKQRNVEISSNNRTRVEGSAGSLLNLLMGIRNFQSTDPRDRIFALLGISDEGLEPIIALSEVLGGHNSPVVALVRRGAGWLASRANAIGPGIDLFRHAALTPNYEKPVVSVYRDFARFCIRKSPRLLDILGHVQHTVDPSETNTYPSWVPKFDDARSVSFFPPGLYRSGVPYEGHYRYFAEVHDCPLHRQPLEPNFLALDGFRIDEVAAVSEPLHFNLNEPLSVEDVWNQIFDHPLFPRSKQRYVNTQEALDIAFFMTLHIGVIGSIGNMGHLLERFSSSRIASFDALERQAKTNLLAWLRDHPKAEPASTYSDLTADAQASLMDGNGESYVRSVWGFCQNRRFYRTRSGFLGVGPQVMKPGDQVVVLFGGNLPFILRRQGDWILVGDTYLHHANILRGREVMTVRSSRGKSRIETFRLK